MYTEYNYDNSLYHFGTKGMRWGIRKYQYENGSLTPAGKMRYGSQKIYDAKKSGNKEKYKSLKKDLKSKEKELYKEIRKTDDFATRNLLYNSATYKKAAKYVNRLDMSIEDAKKKTKKEAIRNTMLMIPVQVAYGYLLGQELSKYYI